MTSSCADLDIPRRGSSAAALSPPALSCRLGSRHSFANAIFHPARAASPARYQHESPQTSCGAQPTGTWRPSSAIHHRDRSLRRSCRAPLRGILGWWRFVLKAALSRSPIRCSHPAPDHSRPSFVRLRSFGFFKPGNPAGPFPRALDPAASASARVPLFEFRFPAKKAAAGLGSSWPYRNSGVPVRKNDKRRKRHDQELRD